MTRKTDTTEIANDVLGALTILRSHILATGNGKVKDAFASVETFSAIGLRLMEKSNPSKIRSIAVAVEIQSLMK
jgi:hypothetical protein